MRACRHQRPPCPMLPCACGTAQPRRERLQPPEQPPREAMEVQDLRHRPAASQASSAERSRRAESLRPSSPALNRGRPPQEWSWWSSRLRAPRRARRPLRSPARRAQTAVPERARQRQPAPGVVPEQARLRLQAPGAEEEQSRLRALPEPVPRAAARSARLPWTAPPQARRQRQSRARRAPTAAPQQARSRLRAARPEQAQSRLQAARPALLRAR